MIEYIGEMIKATAGEDLCIIARVIDSFGDTLETCHMSVYKGDERLFMVEGMLNEDNQYEFYIPAEATAGLKGRYGYCVCDKDGISLCFKCFIYFV
jgi:hypothetical protein